ncbi:hypothetical protein K470DRAFT_129895 [Piedraia hortae CBS 480.64]|uniref:Uncharacterized protein n=1 Tax=Piedraia hortae CBS 480.64 TaxID=1314780 RepID=A0A6A7BT67_9PEZI|nr:hypothetical protein K470DRAFT_129895 [Piedraia hortae CBS 480.64]
MGFWTSPAAAAPAAATTSVDDEPQAEADEPPDGIRLSTERPRPSRRPESLLTRQLHSEPDVSDDSQALSTSPSYHSALSVADLTSDDEHSMTSPALSPSPSATAWDKEVRIAGQEAVPSHTESERSVEATLGRKRCIMFACGKDNTARPSEAVAHNGAIRFANPATCDAKEEPRKRPTSPPPRLRPYSRPFRGSDNTVARLSLTAVRKRSVVDIVAQVPSRKASVDSNLSVGEAARFHEFASSDDEPEEWVREVTCHRSRLTIRDTLQKEHVVRQACEEAAEEAVAAEDAEKESDDGFHSDDESGFASDLDDDSDNDWWVPGASTANTSVDWAHHTHSGTSLNSGRSSPSSRSRPVSMILNDQELPDSTDFVCGTLDEDQALEQAYITRRQEIKAARYPSRPQDIDPSFPTSDPELDEQDDDLIQVECSGDEMDGEVERPVRRLSKSKGHALRSPPPKQLFGQSPRRLRSPPRARLTSPCASRRPSFSNNSQMPMGLAVRPQPTHTSSLPRGGARLLISQMCSQYLSDEGEASPSETRRRGAIDIVKGLERRRERRKEKLRRKHEAKGDKARFKVKPGRGAERMREVGLELQNHRQHILSV